MPNRIPSEFDEDMSFQFKDLTTQSPRSSTNTEYTYCLDNIDAVAAVLSTPWEHSKDKDFSRKFIYIGFEWDLDKNSVSILDSKKKKYLVAIGAWEQSMKHTL